MKYGIEQRLDPLTADTAQRFHAAMMRRLHQIQAGGRVDSSNPLDMALTMMAIWDKENKRPGSPDGSVV